MADYLKADRPKVTTQRLLDMKRAGEKISMLTAYDFTTAHLLDEAGVDCVLVGDSAANVMGGYDTTLPITMEEMVVYARSVRRAVKHALLVCDMPFGSYQTGVTDALRNAVRLMKETGADALKLEGGQAIADVVKALVSAGIPVCGHLGLTPQSVHKFGGYGLRGATEREAERLLADARLLASLDTFAIVLEKIPAELAQTVTTHVSCPTIGIGAGPHTDGQVLVSADMWGMSDGFNPKFVRRFAHLGELMKNAASEFVAEVKQGTFPSDAESYHAV